MRAPSLAYVNRTEFRHSTSHRLALLKMAREHDWKLIVEIGVRLAGTGAYLLANKTDLVYLGIDPFVIPEGTHVETGYTHYGNPDMGAWYREAIANLAPYLPRGVVWKISSLDAAARFNGLKADCVFIDGDHRERHVAADIDAWRGKIKPGGWLTGHDWSWPSVQAAVLPRLGTPEVRAGDVWTVRL
jgi:hypothetical protein